MSKKNHGHGKSLKGKMLKNMVILACVPLVLVGVLIYVNLNKDIRREYESSLVNNLNKCVQLINTEFTMFIQKSNSIIQNKYLIESLQTDYQEDIEKMMVFYANLSMLISEPFGYGDEGYFAVYPFKNSLYEGSYVEKYERIKDDAYIKDIVENPGTNVKWYPKIYKKQYGSSKRYIRFYRNIIDFKTPVGLLEANIPVEVIEEHIGSIGLPKNGLIYLTDSHGELLYFKNNTAVHMTGLNDIKSGDYMLRSQSLPNGFTVYAALPWKTIHREELKIFMILFSILVLIIAVMYTASRISIKRTTASLESFISRLKRDDELLFNEDLIKVSGDDEIAIIKRKFKELISRMNELYKETTEAKLQKSAFEIELLQSRINPHLLYNSLSVIKWNAQWNKDENTTELINSMVKYYRTALNKGNNIIKIKAEIEMVKEYVRINEFSYSSKYALKIDLEPGIDEYFTIKHLMQPIVENSVLHGLNGVTDGTIEIKGCREGEDIIFEIKDNGCGMEESKVAQLLNMSYDSELGGYGIKNLIKRIAMYYGEGYGIDIKSQPNIGTTTVIRISALMEADN